MAASWWDDVHWNLWRVADRADLVATAHTARRVAREAVAPQLVAGARSGCEWTAEKANILASLDANGLTSILSSTDHGIATALSLAAWELAWIDGGAATLCLSGSLAQMSILDFGTKEQKDRYLDNSDRRHAALCLTEPIPGAGSDATFLSGGFQTAEWVPGSEPMLEIRKRGRFISHMDFADFVVAAVQGYTDRVRGSCLVILEPGDAGEFNRGSRVRKIGHQLASTTNPIFDLRVPASRIVGDYRMIDGVVVPNYDHRRLLEPTFRRNRAILSIMTASKLLSVVQPLINPTGQTTGEPECWEQMVELWAAGEAAASLGFSAARLSDELDCRKDPARKLTSQSALLSSAAKLFSTSSATVMLRHAAAFEGCWPIDGSAGFIRDKLLDAQIEALYLGPEALQRRLVSAAMIDGEFLETFQTWTEDLERHGQRLSGMGIHNLTCAMRLWHWTLGQLRQQTDSRGTRLFCDARQGVTFPMADSLCRLLAARSFTLDVLELEKIRNREALPTFTSSLFFDLSAVASANASGSVARACAELLFGYGEHFPVSATTRNAFDHLRAKLKLSLCGSAAARNRIAQFLRAEHQC